MNVPLTDMVHSSPRSFLVERLVVEILENPGELGRAAARAAATALREAIAERGEARVIFGSAPSQDDFLAALVDPEVSGAGLDWRCVTVFHMDDYAGMAGDRRESFRDYLQRHLLNHVAVGKFHAIPAEEPDSDAVCRCYADLLRERPIDLICLGFGENGHIAFNDPPVADFEDPALVKVFEIDEACRRQQVNDGCFETLAEVPMRAITVTVPVFRRARRLTAQVPGARKAAAVRAASQGPISTECPASILRTHPAATLFLEPASASLL